MPVDLPPTSTALGMKVVNILDSAPTSETAPTKANLNAGFFGQCHIYGAEALSPQPNQNTGTAPPKLCTKVEEQRFGRTTWPAFDVQYSIKPQELGTPGADGNEMYELLVPGTHVWFNIANDLDGEATSAFATGDVINGGFYVEVGEYREGQTGTGEYDEFSCTQTLLPKGGRRLHNYVVPAS